jgi:hypothetical protein
MMMNPMQHYTDLSMKHTITNAPLDGAMSSEAALPRPGDELLHITTMKEDQAAVSTQHFGPKRPSTKHGQHFAPFGSAEMENYMGKTTKNNVL